MSIKIKKQQFLALSLISGSIIIVLGSLAYWGHRVEPPQIDAKANFKKHAVASPISSNANEAYWIEKTQNAWRAQEQKSQQMDKHLKALGDEKKKQAQLIQSQEQQIKELKTMMTVLHEEMGEFKKAPKESTGVDEPMKMMQQGDFSEQANNNLISEEQGYIHYSVKLSKSKQRRIKTPENYVFSNTFAKAIVLQGADASAGVLSQSNPDVMIFQIIEDGVMPNKHRTPLKDCFFSASVVGDISSERGKLRTERLSCIHPDGTSLDIPVTGIVADSKNGIRGRPVWRDGPMARKAFWGNFWESMGEMGQRYSTDYSTSPLGSVATIQPAKVPLAAASSGGAGAAKMYAQYTIKRAELYHPVIQLPPNTIVDVTFLKGFWLDGGTDNEEPATQVVANPEMQEAHHSPEEQAAQQFFSKNHAF
ncbi:TrbI/VirB10 family protein [Legionella anisa]|uniref:TrbI/VirB10 family protein n=1 Tax=Legionella anisa TaxID=28082 RepID=UPI00104166B4|nr:TrbI/VirB10 family protein [Legionella anisa]